MVSAEARAGNSTQYRFRCHILFFSTLKVCYLAWYNLVIQSNIYQEGCCHGCKTPLTLRAPFADAGTKKELETHFRDCLLFYIDGRIRFERYCYGEAACLVFSLWANGLDETGKILWVKEPEFEVDQKAIPRVITDVQENGTALQVDNQRKRYVKTEEFDEDKPNGYGRFKVFLLRRKLKNTKAIPHNSRLAA